MVLSKFSRRIAILLLLIIVLLTSLIIYVVYKQENYVARIIDGDTFELTTGERVRLIGIDCPEQGEFYYNESAKALSELILGKKVFLEKDVSETDRYSRLLRYAYIDGMSVNYYLVEKGFAVAAEYPPDTRYADDLRNAEQYAKENNLGMWFSENSEGLSEYSSSCIALGCPAGTYYVGSKNSDKYHECDSRWAKLILFENIVCFSSENEAVAQGYTASN